MDIGKHFVSFRELGDAMERVRETHAAYRLASKRFHLSKKPASIEAARQAMEQTERAYREAAAHRDALASRAGSR